MSLEHVVAAARSRAHPPHSLEASREAHVAQPIHRLFTQNPTPSPV